MLRFALLVALLFPAQAALAILAAPPRLMIGSVFERTITSPGGSVCSVKPGPAGFQRDDPTTKQANPDAMLSLPEVKFTNQSKTVSYTGIATLGFSTATTGKIVFDDDEDSDTAPTTTVPFVNYSESYDQSNFKLRVSFTIQFKGCALPVKALFRAAPQPHLF